MLYAGYDEQTCCMLVMMADMLYASYDGRHVVCWL